MEELLEFTEAQYITLSVKHSPFTGQPFGNQLGGGWLSGKEGFFSSFLSFTFRDFKRDSYDLQLQLLDESILGFRIFLLWAAKCALIFLVVQ